MSPDLVEYGVLAGPALWFLPGLLAILFRKDLDRGLAEPMGFMSGFLGFGCGLSFLLAIQEGQRGMVMVQVAYLSVGYLLVAAFYWLISLGHSSSAVKSAPKAS